MNFHATLNAQYDEAVAVLRQGSFFVGGRQVKACGAFDERAGVILPSTGQTFWTDQMYVQYQVPLNPRRYPLVFVHGGGGTGQVWETTPDGREGFQTIFLRRGFAVYTVDAPRGGRSGFPGFNGELGKLDASQQIVPDSTFRPGIQHAWSRWRLGPRYPEVFERQAFPMEAVDQFFKHVRPIVSDDAEVVSHALVTLLERIGPAILVTHSNGGLWGWLAASRCANVKAVVSYEPGFVFPRGKFPPSIKLFKGCLPPGTPIESSEFRQLASVPIQIVFGDNIPSEPVPELPADARRAQLELSHLFVRSINNEHGKASVLMLSDVGLTGNSHFMFLDTNNLEVADQLSSFLSAHELDIC
ncbi:Alpha/beta hydrolase family protein [Caballeronia calidae]|uniref:Alpha/beta hydrolase family protein n=1 Tax=Caballeronia calidae TaxID=1777139 RepID=A0A158EFZ1_9BURK|nr:alpha/beta fold hydrolase [Caballeronia calidae]SAL05620.1 Alpha/beta hydrolase family protein [Caballeronia calidae]